MTTLLTPASETASEPSTNAPEINVGQTERAASVLGGSLLTLLGIRQRSNLGVLMAVIGGSLVYRGMTGHCPTYAALGKNTAYDEGEADAPKFFENAASA